MSLTSCFRYIIELPTNTLNGMIDGILKEADAAGIQTSFHRENVAVGTYHATVDAHLSDLDTHPPTMDLLAADLAFVLHLRMSVQAQITEIPILDSIVYQAAFAFPGVMVKSAAVPPVLNMTFPAVTTGSLNLTLDGGAIVLTPALVEPRVHALYQANPSFQHQVKSGVATGLSAPDDVWQVTVDIYDDAPGSPGFRGAITVDVPDQGHVKINLPGHLKAKNINNATRIDTDMTVHVTVAVTLPVNPTDDRVTVSLSTVTAANVAIDYASPNLYTVGGDSTVRAQIATAVSGLGDFHEDVPSRQQVRDLIAAELVDYASHLIVPIFKPDPPASGAAMDLTTFVPTTVSQQVLALQIEPVGGACDTPDVFTGTSGFAVSVNRDKVNATIQPVIAAENGRTRNIQGHDVEVHDLTADLSDPGEHGQAVGHVWIAGQATVHIQCWPDAHINFSGPLTLTPEMQPDGGIKFHAHAGGFTADDPKCASVDPGQIAALIEADDYPPITGLPSNFTGVGRITITVNATDIFRAGIVIKGDLAVITTHTLQASDIQHSTYWDNEPAGGR
ncbi:MAG TPA: hypothetical protein VGK32_05740 [Vicinamibacterales bacterium]